MTTADDKMPTSLLDFGYAFNDAGQLRQLDETGLPTDRPYEFVVRPKDAAHNQRRYEALGDLLTEHVFALLVEAGLQRVPLPGGAFVYANRPDLRGSQKLLVLIHGSGVVRAGQWARSLIVNQSLDHGTQLPYIRRALALGYDVLVLDANRNRSELDGQPLPNSAEPHQHAALAWQTIVQPALDDGDAPRIALVAHSYGGLVALGLLRRFGDQFLRHVRAVAFTDSVHGQPVPGDAAAAFCRRALRHWVASDRPLNEPIGADRPDQVIPCYSAGHAKHEWTSWACIDPLFEFVQQRLDEQPEDDIKVKVEV